LDRVHVHAQPPGIVGGERSGHAAAVNGAAFLLVIASLVHSVCAQMTVQITGTITANMNLSGSSQQSTFPVTAAGVVGAPGGVLVTTLGTTTSLNLSSFAYSFAFSASGVADLRLQYASNTPLAGVLRITGTPGAISAFVAVDVDADGQAELVLGTPQAATAVDVPVVLGPRAIAVDVDLSASVGSNQGSSANVTVQFLPQANLSTDGVGCGSILAASVRKPTATTAGRLWLHVDDAPVPASAIGAILIGSTPLPMGATCGQGLIDDALILVNPASGAVDLPAALSTALLGSVDLQYVGLKLPFQLSWSNRIELTLP
jgi:hypothetical protein